MQHTRRWRKVWLHGKLFDSRHQASLSVTIFLLFFLQVLLMDLERQGDEHMNI